MFRIHRITYYNATQRIYWLVSIYVESWIKKIINIWTFIIMFRTPVELYSTINVECVIEMPQLTESNINNFMTSDDDWCNVLTILVSHTCLLLIWFLFVKFRFHTKTIEKNTNFSKQKNHKFGCVQLFRWENLRRTVKTIFCECI